MADREFVGKDWFGWVLKEKISFHIIIKNNTITTNAKGLKIDIDALFYGLKPNEQRCLIARRFVWGHFVYLALISTNIELVFHLFRQCLNRRLENMDEVESEIKAWVEHRNKNAYVVNWQFTTEDARIKLKRLYRTIKDKINLME